MACRRCTPELNPAGPMRHEGHGAVRFPNGWRLFVFKDGEQILDCYEVDVLAGKAWRYTSPFDWCECGSGQITAYVDEGRFSITAATLARGS